MRPAPSQPWFGARDAPLLHRSATLAVVVALHILLLILLLRLAPVPPPRTFGTPITVTLVPNAPIAAAPERAAKAAPVRGGAPEPTIAPPPEAPPPPAPPTLPPPPVSSGIWSTVIPMTRQEYAAADISRFPSRAPAAEGAGESERGADRGEEGADTEGPGRGPNGELLYNAQWYRRPTRAELSTYIPAGAPRSGWGIIACQTVPGYRVDNCQEIAQSPGSGLAGAVRQAAWQFRVLPPRIGGRVMVGAWVRIRIDYTVEREE